MRKRLIVLLLSAAAAFPVGAEEPAAAEKEGVLAIVNGRAITQADYDLYREQRASGDPRRVPGRQSLLQELINREVIYQDAKHLGLDKTPEFLTQLEAQRINLLTGYAISKQVELQGEPTEEDLKKEYERVISTMSLTEYKGKHILVGTEDEAKAAIAELDKGRDFSELAKEKSTDVSGPHGGDLGWFQPEQMTEPFAEAVAKMKPGTYTKEPVKTDFGWHVIQLEDSRRTAPPEFDMLKEQIASALYTQRLQKYIRGLREEAKIEIK